MARAANGPYTRRHLVLGSVFLLLSAAPRVPAQEPTAEPPPPPAGLDVRESLETLRALRDTIEAKREALNEAKRGLEESPAGADGEPLLQKIASLREELRRLETSYESVATGLDLEEFEAGVDRPFDIKTELEALLAPLLRELKKATEDPRQLDELRQKVEHYEQRQQRAEQGISHLEALVAKAEDPELRRGLEATLTDWRRTKNEMVNRATVARYQLETRRESRKSLLESASAVAGNFFRTRGLHMALASGAFLAVFITLRFLYYRVLTRRRRRLRSLLSRLFTVLFFLFAFVAAVFAALMVLYAAGDWVLLAIALVFLFGLAWASRQAVPTFFEDIRMLLNLGPVRENERLVLDGIPWRVVSLNIYTTLENPELIGGRIRLPIRALASLHSRPCAEEELWFPCRVGDWVRLADGNLGEVVYQSPELVQIVLVGGDRVTYPTAEFLGQHPGNLSRGFALRVVFGVDYRHQEISTTEIPRVMREAVQRGLAPLSPDGKVRRLVVEFTEAGPSSLDLLTLIEFDGQQAGSYERLRRTVQRILVDTCNDRGWVIPFTQVTIHNAEAAA